MIFESKRLLELAGIKGDESSNILTEGIQAESLEEFENTDGVTEDDADEAAGCYEAEENEEVVVGLVRRDVVDQRRAGRPF